MLLLYSLQCFTVQINWVKHDLVRFCKGANHVTTKILLTYNYPNVMRFL